MPATSRHTRGLLGVKQDRQPTKNKTKILLARTPSLVPEETGLEMRHTSVSCVSGSFFFPKQPHVRCTMGDAKPLSLPQRESSLASSSSCCCFFHTPLAYQQWSWFRVVLLMLLVVGRSVSSFAPRQFPSPGRCCVSGSRSNQLSWIPFPNHSTIGSRISRVMSSSSSEAITQRLLEVPTVPLRNGMAHPLIGFGTYKVGVIPASASSAVAAGTTDVPEQRNAQDCIADALTAGYRFLECSEFYGNQVQVGQAMAASGIPRDQLFVCSKVWTTTIEQGADAIQAQLQSTLQALQTDYLDLYLIHWPVPGHHVAAYKILIQLRNQGLIKGIGVSNYAWEDYVELKKDPDIGDDDLPLVNQIEINPFLYRSKTIGLFQQEGVVLQAYRSLRNGKAMQDPLLQSIAAKYPLSKDNDTSSTRTVAQILGRWCIQHGFCHTPKSLQPSRMVENANILDFTLSEEDMHVLDTQFTTPETIAEFRDLYRKCVNRDTSKDGTLEGVKMEITET